MMERRESTTESHSRRTRRSRDDRDSIAERSSNEPLIDIDKPNTDRDGGAGDGSEPTIIFTDHVGKRYVFPFERCNTWDSFKHVLEEVYGRTLDGDEDRLLGAVRQGKFDIVSDGGDIILPGVWTSIIRPHAILRISFWAGVVPPGDHDSVSRVSLSRGVQFARVDQDDSIHSGYSSTTNSRRRIGIYQESDEVESEDSNSVTEEEEGTSEPPTAVEPVRVVLTPTDKDGNELSFAVDTKHALRHANVSKESVGKGEELEKLRNAREMKVENLRISKAVCLAAEGRTSLQIHTLPGPEGSSSSSSIDIRWCHLSADQLDFAQFKSACLSVQGLSDRLQLLIKKTLGKIEKERVKVFLGGMFIEPGTVLRCEETNQSDPQSVIFTCIPYFELQSSSQKTTAQSDRLYPARSLIQTYYPFEPVRERDAEQAYKKFGNEKSGNIIYVPTLWMMNIGTYAVVTCGYRPLASEFVKSITVIQEDMKLLDSRGGEEATLTNIRLTDWDGRHVLYSIDECKTYFEMEQKLKELRFFTSGSVYGKDLLLALTTSGNEARIGPKDWPSIIKRRDRIFIDLSVIGAEQTKESEKEISDNKYTQILATTSLKDSVPPFFYWPPAAKHGRPEDSVLTEVKRSMLCLEFVEKAMLSETLPEYETTNAVDRTFTSTNYYQSLPEDTIEHIKPNFVSLVQVSDTAGEGTLNHTYHQTIVHAQCSKLGEKATELINIVYETLRLFVPDVDKHTMLRKLWGAMACVAQLVNAIQERDDCKPNVNKAIRAEYKASTAEVGPWFVRRFNKTAPAEGYIPQPEGDDAFKQSIRRCKLCRHFRPYQSSDEAIEHLRAHLAQVRSEQSEAAVVTSPQKEPSLQDWIRNDAQRQLEEYNAGALAILSQTSEAARILLEQLRELSQGVMDEDGNFSNSYTFPRYLLETFRRLIVFYLAIERALHHNKECFLGNLKDSDMDLSPSSTVGLEVLERFSESVRTSIATVRNDLCDMVRSPTPVDIYKRLAYGPEYLCAWFMRRLIVKPLEKSMSVSDMYREYLSTIQFQVNHRPGKRLLRSITLLQEELQILSKVNAWQCKLIANYSRVLDDNTYEKDIPFRRAMYPCESLLLRSVLENLALTREEYADQIQRCGPLSESTKQSAEINEEDHGKAILVFTVVTVIFLPLSFVTSYLGMNTVDIRDMDNRQSLFWEIAIPLTTVTMGSVLFIAYYGDELRDRITSMYRFLAGKQPRSTSSRGISVAQRKRAAKRPSESSSTLDYKSLADEAEFATPKPEYWTDDYTRAKYADYNYAPDRIQSTLKPERQTYAEEEILQASFEPEPEYRKTTSTLRMQPRMQKEFAPPIPLREDTRPIWPKVLRKHLDPQTLIYYGIPFDYDSLDPSYILIKQEMDEREVHVLMEHTRVLREREGRGDGYAYGGRGNMREGGMYVPRKIAVHDTSGEGRQRPQEYTWTKHRKGRGRHVGPGERGFAWRRSGMRERSSYV